MTAFTIVIPAYDAAATLPAALASVRAQTDQDYDVVVVDDGSRDATAEVAERHGPEGRTRVVRQANAGLPAARNAGLRAATGRWIAFLDSDDLLMPGYLARMRHLLERAPDAGLAYCDAWIFDERSGRFYRRSAMGPFRPPRPPEDPREFFRALLRGNFVYVSACAPRAVLEALGGFDETLRAAEDWEMWLRVVAAGHRAVGTTERLGIYRRSSGQMSADPQRMVSGVMAAVAAVARFPDLPEDLLPEVRAREAEAAAALERLSAAPATARPALLAWIARMAWPRNQLLRTPGPVAAAFPNLVSTRGLCERRHLRPDV